MNHFSIHEQEDGGPVNVGASYRQILYSKRESPGSLNLVYKNRVCRIQKNGEQGWGSVEDAVCKNDVVHTILGRFKKSKIELQLSKNV